MGLPLDLQKCRLRITTAIKLDVVVCVCVCLKDLCWDKSLFSFIVFATYLFWSGCTHAGPTDFTPSLPSSQKHCYGQPFPHLPNPRPALPLPPLPVYFSFSLFSPCFLCVLQGQVAWRMPGLEQHIVVWSG